MALGSHDPGFTVHRRPTIWLANWDVPAPEGTNVVLARSHDATLLVSARPPAEPITGQAASVPVPQVLADLMTLPGRSAQEAEQIMDLLARTDPRWAEDTDQP